MFHFLVIYLFAALIGSCSSQKDDSSYMNLLRTNLKVPQWSPSTNYCQWNGVSCDASSRRVTAINLKGQSLSGKIPDGINSLKFLKSLSLQQNFISGPLPSFSGLSSLQDLYLDSNLFTSIPSSCFKGLTSLQEFSISDNALLQPWQIPYEDLAGSASLVKFYAANASIYGSIPDMFGSFPNMQELRLSYNNIDGPLPASMAGSGLVKMWLNNQNLSGSIEVLSKMSELSQAWIHVNGFTGPVPDLSNCTQLFDLEIRDNHLTGVLPPSIFKLPNLVNVSLANNRLQGPYPAFSSNVKATIGDANSFCLTTPGTPCDPQVTILLEIASALGYPLVLADSWLGNDVCNGWSFVSCDPQTKKVISITFGKQGFTGTISPSFSKLTYLKTLLLNENNLYGTIPSSLTSLSQLKTLDVSNNDLSGPLPVFAPNVTLKTAGNKKLLSGDSSDSKSGSSSSGNGSRNNLSKGVTAAVLVFCAILFVAVVLFVCYRCYITKRKSLKPGKTEMEMGIDNEEENRNSVQIQVFEGGNVFYPISLLREVTDNFNGDNVLGRGGFGVVYKGVLQDGSVIAVKRMEGDKTNKGLNEFKAEIGVLTKVRHRHLVALLGFCITEDERLLVYEYMPQGTLAQRLFEYKQLGYPSLSWKQRLSIALDVARGVEYLHSLARESFIHRDLKPSNILLGDDMRAKVADFGLVKIAPDGKYSLETKLAGTFGYLAPEYAATGRVTTKVDVYAYGVVLMEIITGRKSLDEKEPEEKAHLVPWFRRVLIGKEDNISILIDKTINPDEETYMSICKVAELASHCTARESYQRPDMSHVVSILGPLVEQWTPSDQQNNDGYANDPPMSLPQVLEAWLSDEVTSSIANGFDSGTTSTPVLRGNPSEFKDTFSMEGR